MKSGRLRGTSITVSPYFGSRLKYLRLQKRWSQKELSRQSSIIGGSRISTRIIGTIERSESLNFDKRTLEILSITLGLTLDSLLDQTPPFSQSFSSLQPTTLFTNILEEIRLQILDGERLIIIEGESGVGKSRLVSSLFSVELSQFIVLWFTGENINEFEKLVSHLIQARSNLSQSYVIILDEDYQSPVRNTNFFLELFRLPNLNSIKNHLTLICSIRDETYQLLSELGCLTKLSLTSLENRVEQLDDYRVWKLSQPISSEQREWLFSVMTDDQNRLQLNTFLLDKVFIPFIRQNSWKKLTFDYKQVVESTYQGLIQSQSLEHRTLYRSIQWSTEISDRTPLYLVHAVLNSQLGENIKTIQQTRNMIWYHKFTRIEHQPFFDQKPIWRSVYYTKCLFSHDLIREVVKTKFSFVDHIDLDLVLEQLILTISQQKNQLNPLIESIAAWLSLLDRYNRGFPQISQLIGSRVRDLIDSGRVSPLEVGYHFFTMCWFLWGNKFKDRNDLRDPTIFQDIERVTEIIVSYFQPRDIDVLCKMRPDGGSAYPLISCFSSWFTSLGMYSNQLKNEPFWGLLENEIPCLSDLGYRLTKDHRLRERSIDSGHLTSSTSLTLQMWSGQYKDVGNYLQTINYGNDENSEPTDKDISYSRLMSLTGNHSGLVDSYLNISTKTKSKAVQNFYQKRIEKIKSNNISGGYRNFEKALSNFDEYESSKEVIIIDGADMTYSFVMGELLHEFSIKYRIIDGIILDSLSILPDKGRFITIGRGHYNYLIDIFSQHIPSTTLESVIKKTVTPPHFGWYNFNLNDRQFVWIVGGWNEKIKEGVIKWFESDDRNGFLVGKPF